MNIWISFCTFCYYPMRAPRISSYHNYFLSPGRAIFTWASKVICVCFSFALVRSVIGLKNSRFFLNQSEVRPKPIPSKTNCDLLAQVFRASCNCLELWSEFDRVLIGQWIALRPLWLARVITSVLVLRHSVNNCSKTRKDVARSICCGHVCPMFPSFTIQVTIFFRKSCQ